MVMISCGGFCNCIDYIYFNDMEFEQILCIENY